MISRQKQIGVLRSLLIEELNKARVKDNIASALRNKGQVGSGNLESVIKAIEYSRALSLRNTRFDEKTGIMVSVDILIEFDFSTAPYIKFLNKPPIKELDTVNGGAGGYQRILRWVKEKPSNTWRFNSAPIDDKEQRRVAKAIFFSKKNNGGGIKNTSNFYSFGKSITTSAINKAVSRFVNYWEEQFVLEAYSQISSINL